MIHVLFAPPQTPAWDNWVHSCEAAGQQHSERRSQGLDSKVSSLYRQQKEVFLGSVGAFHGKCAYCESFIASTQHGDLDHYRPKDGVRDEQNQMVMVVAQDGNPRPHPGYYWLAYHWRNLLPCCRKCNQLNKDPASGRTIGKGMRFPVGSFRAESEGQEAGEEPLLINPVLEDPADHLEVDDLGIMSGRTPKGATTVELLGLNARELVDRRRGAYKATRAKLGGWTSQICLNGLPSPAGQQARYEAEEEIQHVERGEVEFAAAARKALHECREEIHSL